MTIDEPAGKDSPAGPGSGGGSPCSAAPADVVPFPARPSYLDACREQGVFQKDEETRAEIFETSNNLAGIRAETRRRHGDPERTPELRVVENGPSRQEPASITAAIAEGEARAMARVRTIMDAYARNGLGDAHFPMLQHIVCESPLKAEHAYGTFHASLACRSTAAREDDGMTADARLHEQRRLNAEGLNTPLPPTPQPSTRDRDHAA